MSLWRVPWRQFGILMKNWIWIIADFFPVNKKVAQKSSTFISPLASWHTLTEQAEQNEFRQSLQWYFQFKRLNRTLVHRKQTLPLSMSVLRLSSTSSILARFKTDRMWTTSSCDSCTDEGVAGDVSFAGRLPVVKRRFGTTLSCLEIVELFGGKIGVLPNGLQHVGMKISSTNLCANTNCWHHLSLIQTCSEG